MKYKDKPLVSIISINYNGLVLTRGLLESLRNISYPEVEILVVDNGSQEAPDTLLEEFPEIKLVKSEQNLGFAGGNNLGMQHAQGDFFLLINNDVEVDPNFLEPLVSVMLTHPEVGIISPKIVYHYAQDTIQYAGGRAINLMTGRGSFVGSKAKDDGTYDTSGYTELAHGAAMMIRREVVQKVGMKAGFQLWYEAGSRILHKEYMTVGKLSPLKSYYMNRNRVAFMRRHAKGWKKSFSIFWFMLISLPSQTLRYLLKGQRELILPMFRGAIWNFKNQVKFPNPAL